MAKNMEDLEQKRKLSFIIKMQDQKIIQEHKWDMKNVCNKCFVTKTKSGKCSMGCDE